MNYHEQTENVDEEFIMCNNCFQHNKDTLKEEGWNGDAYSEDNEEKEEEVIKEDKNKIYTGYCGFIWIYTAKDRRGRRRVSRRRRRRRRRRREREKKKRKKKKKKNKRRERRRGRRRRGRRSEDDIWK